MTYREEFLNTAIKCGAVLTGKPDASEPITIVFSIEAWRKFDTATNTQQIRKPAIQLLVNPTDDQLAQMDQGMRAWELKAARMECSWICGDCSQTFYEGMPDKCACGHQSCTDIIQRDKAEAGVKT